MLLIVQHQPDENQGVDELLLPQEYEQFLSSVEMPIEESKPRSNIDSRIYHQGFRPLDVFAYLEWDAPPH
jgi:hypothetical protein